jgi:hypothetical protein
VVHWRMTSRERVQLALDHREADRVPLDLGSTSVTGMHVSTVYRLRQALGLDRPGTPVKVVECYQMQGEIGADLLGAVGADVVGVRSRTARFGFASDGWKEWRLFDGTPVLVPGLFNTEPDVNGDILQYPEGDTSLPPSGRMPKGGFYFDLIVRQHPIDEERLDPEDNVEEFRPLPAEALAGFAADARTQSATGRAVVLNLGGTSFGDIGQVPGPMLRDPKGIRDIEEWYVSTLTRRPYVRAVFERQCAIALANLERAHAAIGDLVSVLQVSGADFGAQTGAFIPPDVYRSLYLPFHKAVNDWVHAHTRWRTFIHSCGSVIDLLPGFIEAGFDILNPVQTSAAGMDPRTLKTRFGDRVVFWGGGVDTQKTLPFGTPGEVRREVTGRLAVFSPGGGFVFNPVHNVQAGVPIENLRALYDTVRERGAYR